MADCADLEIGLDRHDERSYAIKLRLQVPGSESDLRPSDREPLLVAFDTEILTALAAQPAAYGKELSNRLFAGDAARLFFAKARAAALGQVPPVPLRLRLAIGPDALELHHFCWETLRDPEAAGNLFLAHDENVRFSRYLSSDSRRPVIAHQPDELKVLLLIADPTNLKDWGLTAPDVAAELSRAKAALENTRITVLSRNCAPGFEYAGPATVENLIGEVRNGYDIVYICCHGRLLNGITALWLEKENGSADLIFGGDAPRRDGEGPAGLATQFEQLSVLPRLVMLASCQTADSGGDSTSTDGGALSGLGPRLSHAGVPAVVAMQGNITVQTASGFMGTVFTELRRDGQIDRAVAAARHAVRARADWWAPVLYMRIRNGSIWTQEPRVEPGVAGAADESREHGVFVQTQRAGGHSAIDQSSQEVEIESDPSAGRLSIKQDQVAEDHSRITGSSQKVTIRRHRPQ